MSNKKTIFIAEDNPTNMKLINDILSYQGYAIIQATDGKMALERIKENKDIIDLILMDVQLPEMDGISVIKKIKSDDSTKNIPIFVISAYAMENDIKNAREAGCNEYITKPINVQNFIKLVNEVFSPVK